MYIFSLSSRDTSNVKNLYCVFSFANFGNSVKDWDTSKVTGFSDICYNGNCANIDIGGWCVHLLSTLFPSFPS